MLLRCRMQHFAGISGFSRRGSIARPQREQSRPVVGDAPVNDSCGNDRIVAREVSEQRKALAGAHLAAVAFAARAFVLQPDAHRCAPCLVERCEELRQVLPHGFSLFGATFSLFPPARRFFFFACFFFFRNNSVLYGDGGGRRCGLQRFAGHRMDLRGRNRRVVLCRMTLKGI